MNRLKPGYCPYCNRKDYSEIIDDDGPHNLYFQCDRCGFTWRQNGRTGKPIIKSFGSGKATHYFRALTEGAGIPPERARALTKIEFRGSRT